MERKTLGLLSFGIIIFVLYAFGVDIFVSVWSFPSSRSVPIMVIALVGTGIFATIKLGFPQIKYIRHGINVTRGIYDNPEDEGDLNHFRALTTALSATVGIGNIAGVATAIYYGGPGALFWMWVTAFFGTTLKYAECTLALKYREMDAMGLTAGGPMYTIEHGLGKNWRWMAAAFASFAVICSFATGNAIQSFTVSDQIYSEVENIIEETYTDSNGNGIFDSEPFRDANDDGIIQYGEYQDINNNGQFDSEPFDDKNENGIRDDKTNHPLILKHQISENYGVSILQILTGILMSIIVGIVIIGGIKRIGTITGFLAPIMAIIYIISASIIIIFHFDAIPESLGMIISMAFNPPATIAGTGGGIMLTIIWGIKRGLYSNEAGQGSAAIAHSTAKTNYPIREGAVAMLGPYIDTLIICTMTGLVIISTGAWKHTQFYVNITAPTVEAAKFAIENKVYNGMELYNASLLTSFAFDQGLSFIFGFGDKIVTISVLLFAISTAIAWSFYGNRAAVYLFGEKAITPYLWIYVFFVFIGGIAKLEAVWDFGDAALGIMTFPNLISIVLLTGVLKRMTKDYFSIEHENFRDR